jgi:hypothetical protein
MKKSIDLFNKELSVVNVGLSSMADALRSQQVKVTDLNWKPTRTEISSKYETSAGILVDEANQLTIDHIRAAQPTLIGMGLARDVLPGMHDFLLLHAGPPISWENMCGPTRGAIMGALIYEGIADDRDSAENIAASGRFEFSPCHHHNAVGPMAGVISPSMPVFIVEDKTYGNTAYCTQNEGLGKVLRYGGMGEEVYERLKWMKSTLYPVLDRALQTLPDGINLNLIIAQAPHMGDECHNRNRAGTSLFLRAIMPALARTSKDNDTLAQVIEFIDRNDHFFLNLSMPAGKASLLSTKGIEGSSIISVMARNGTEFGIQISSMPDQWFTAPAGIVDGLYLPGYAKSDANPDIGDSTITETAGFGAFAMAAAPAITQFVGGSPQSAINTTLEMYEITYGTHDRFTIPTLNFRGTPLGVDLRYVIETGILPHINTGIAHREPGLGMVGAGTLRAPMTCFQNAYAAYIDHYFPNQSIKQE